MEFRKTEAENYLKLSDSFSPPDQRIFPLSRNPNFYKLIADLYMISFNQTEIGFLYLLKKQIVLRNELMNEVGIYISEEFRNFGYGTKAITEFLSSHKNLCLAVSENNTKMLKIALNISLLFLLKVEKKIYYFTIN